MQSRTVLLVEDDPNDEHLTLRALRQSGVPASVVVTRSGHEALDFLRRTGTYDGRSSADPLVIFLDHTLPGFAGADLVKTIREIGSINYIPIVVFSGTSDRNVIDRCIRAGANSFLEKPVEMDSYIKQVTHAVRYWLALNLAPCAPSRRATVI